MKNRILIVEDEKLLRDVLCDYFLSRQDTPVGAADGYEALDRIAEQEFDAVLLDIMMPGINGFSVCRKIRETQDVPIIFLTALSEEDEKLYGYEIGADDYVTKPFSMAVLYAKTDALIRRRRGSLVRSDILSAGPLEMNLSTGRVLVAGMPVTLTAKEHSLLECLMRNRGQILSREQLLDRCWGYDYDGDIRVVDTQIRRLRDKLGEHGSCIRTVIKAGYKMEVSAKR